MGQEGVLPECVQSNPPSMFQDSWWLLQTGCGTMLPQHQGSCLTTIHPYPYIHPIKKSIQQDTHPWGRHLPRQTRLTR